ncbi:MAG: signal peptidase II [Clostridia bacterium]|nr:signal peptidase II [Clostridia bacterium]
MTLIALFILIDQITKIFATRLEESKVIIKGILNFTYVENRGAVFGLMQGSNYIMAVLSAIICIALIIYLAKLIKDKKTPSIGFYMVIAGGIGNIIDRIFRGYVVDFIDTPFVATFNVADMLVVIGACFIILSQLKEIMKDGK